jgi:coproporphyrinogen III oxidase-like Fe-S oxidoreductase/MoaA/NifB/PqqE/SkfB family radical SAM enzyme
MYVKMDPQTIQIKELSSPQSSQIAVGEPIKKHNLGRLIVNRICNQRCVFCSYPPVGGQLPLEELKKKIIQLRQEGATDLSLTGGEPTLHPNFFDILEFGVQAGFEEFSVQSNGTMFFREEFVQRLKKIPSLKVSVSFHASDEKTFGELSKAPHTYKQTLKGFEMLGKHKISTFIVVVIQKSNYLKLKDHLAFICSNYPFITHFSFNYIDAVYKAKENPWTVPTFSESSPYIREALQFLKDNGKTFRIEKIPPCFIGGFEEFHSDFRRDLFDETRANAFFRVKGDLHPTEFQLDRKLRMDYSSECKECSLLSICPGVSSNYRSIHGLGELKPVRDVNVKDIIARAYETKTKLSEWRGKGLELKGPSSLQSPPTIRSTAIFEKKVKEDLELFTHAVKIKPNKHNVYDTYSRFLMKNVGYKDENTLIKLWEGHLAKVKGGKIKKQLDFYLHMPYCKTNCSFCVYASTLMNNDSQVEGYVDILIEQAKRFSPTFKGVKFDTFYMGGGTPSVFSSQQLDRLFSYLFSAFSFEENAETSIELNPQTTTLEKLKVLEKYNFNKISMGVQSLSPRVLKINNRMYQTKKMVEDAITNFKKCDFHFLNTDLVLGLRGDTPEEFLYSFEELCRMGPNNICIYPLKINEEYLKQHYGGYEEFDKFFNPLFEKVTHSILPIADKYGFKLLPICNLKNLIKPIVFTRGVQNSRQIHSSYGHFTLEANSIFGLGYYAHSRIAHALDYRYVDKQKRSPMFLKGFASSTDQFGYDVDIMSPRFERVKYITQKFAATFSIPREDYGKRYGSDVIDDFPYAINALRFLGAITVDDHYIRFHPEDEKAHYEHLLFFSGSENVKRIIPQTPPHLPQSGQKLAVIPLNSDEGAQRSCT